MARKKLGDLRLLKDGRAFGPTNREELDRLLAAGRLALADHVSVGNADWITIAEFLAAPVVSETPPAPAAADSAARPSPSPKARVKKGDLRVLSGGRIVASLARGDVEQLHVAGRVGDDDLISALNGPWMAVRDFLAPPEPSIAPPEEVTAEPEPVWTPPLVDPVALRRPTGSPPAESYPLSRLRPPVPPTTDEWYVRVRGIHSAPLRKNHVQALYQAREITLDSTARHATWHDNDWRPIHSIPQLADVTGSL